MLCIHDSLTGAKQPLRPLEPNHVRLYVCGMTVYDYCHLGHARAMIVFDMVVGYLRARGYRVTFVRNITDVDDKIIRRAAQTGTTPDAVAETFTRAMHEDVAALGLIAPDAEPRATAHIEDIVALIARLVDAGHAYAPGNGDVYFEVARFAAYGRLSGKRINELRAGERVAPDPAKRDPLDFALWKAAKPGEPAWGSPWGRGRPGWHIECSAMAGRCLGETFDIHGGGMDLKFPHHENEIAQSEAASGKPFAKVWMHNGFVTVDDEKMAKSLGNFLTIRDVLARHKAEVVRYFVLASHYRSPLAYTEEQLVAAASALTRLYQALRGIGAGEPAADSPYAQRFHAAMDDDFNTPDALAVLFEAAREINRLREQAPEPAAALAATVVRLGASIGLLQEAPEAFFQDAGGDADAAGVEAAIKTAIAARRAARAARDFAAADRIRDELAEQGIVLEDGAGGTTWRRGN